MRNERRNLMNCCNCDACHSRLCFDSTLTPTIQRRKRHVFYAVTHGTFPIFSQTTQASNPLPLDRKNGKKFKFFFKIFDKSIQPGVLLVYYFTALQISSRFHEKLCLLIFKKILNLDSYGFETVWHVCIQKWPIIVRTNETLVKFCVSSWILKLNCPLYSS